MAMHLHVFDDGCGRWGPLTDLRAVFELRSGAVTTLRRIERAVGAPVAALHVPERLADVVTARCSVPVNEPATSGDVLLVNGRWLAVHHRDAVAALQPGQALVQHDGQLIAAHLDAAEAQRVIERRFQLPANANVERVHVARHDDSADADTAGAPTTSTPAALIERPWHLLAGLEASLQSDLAATDLPAWCNQTDNVTAFGDHAFKVADDATVRPNVSVNTQRGPVVIDAGAEVHPFVSLQGPCYIGQGSVVQPHASIRANTVVGPTCKVGGEVSFAIMQGYANKAHSGFLGHALVGQWVNLGADTNVSNLKNTYGPVRVQLEPDAPAEDTGLTFLGPIIGDFTLTAIGARLPTGACVATATMLALSGFAPKLTDRFSFHTDAGEQRYDIDRFLETARRMTERRGCTLSEAEVRLLRGLASVSAATRVGAVSGV